jgi:hypothetical protein
MQQLMQPVNTAMTLPLTPPPGQANPLTLMRQLAAGPGGGGAYGLDKKDPFGLSLSGYYY